ncbi:MAG TPA: exo-alpha-sialidase [Candidatus Faecivicinus avistercoris]|nr:exo-alpha-sialidase [Candidatus Faecivicinus avistercoris]
MLTHVELERFGQGGYRIYRVPSIVCTARGTLLVCYECRFGGDWSAMDLALRRSADGGETWSERVILAPGRGVDAVHNGVLFVDGEAVHLIYHRNYRRAFHQRSDDDGRTWTPPREITDALQSLRTQYNWTVFAAGPGHGLTMSTGRMVVPVWVSANRECITSHHPSVVTTLYSDDHGETWACGEIIWDAPDFVDPNESVLAELPDGRIMINCRHETGKDARKVGFSPDGIRGWEGFHFDERLVDPVCAAGIAQGDGRLWFVNCACRREEGRVRLTVRESGDGGATWPKSREIAAEGGYSDIAYDPSRKMLCVAAETGRAVAGETFSFGLSVERFPADAM